MSDLENLNFKIIQQRFKELETEISGLKETIIRMENNQGNMQNLIQAQTEMIQKVWVSKNGTGGTDGN